MAGESILIVEDEENLVEALRYNLVKEGYQTLVAGDGESGLRLAQEAAPDLVILDVILPKLDGVEVCRLLRRDATVPILMLTAKGEEIDRVVGLEVGADDYVAKPFSMRELLARIHSLLRRARMSASAAAPPEALAVGDLVVDAVKHQVTLGGDELDIRPREFDLLYLLAANKGRALTRDQMLERVWGHDYIGDSRTVDVHIRWLRQKLYRGPGSSPRIITIRGVGYRLEG